MPVSCCGILNYQATEETWKKLLNAVTAARDEYQLKLKQLGINPAVAVDCDQQSPTVPPLENAEIVVTSTIVEAPETKTLLDLMKLSLKDK